MWTSLCITAPTDFTWGERKLYTRKERPIIRGWGRVRMLRGCVPSWRLFLRWFVAAAQSCFSQQQQQQQQQHAASWRRRRRRRIDCNASASRGAKDKLCNYHHNVTQRQQTDISDSYYNSSDIRTSLILYAGPWRLPFLPDYRVKTNPSLGCVRRMVIAGFSLR